MRFRRTFESLAIFNYRVFWLGQLVSVSGTWMQSTAQAWLVLKMTNSPLALGTVTMLQFLPVTVLTLFGGVLADRLPKRKVVFCTQTVAALQALLLAVLVLTNTVQLWQIYALALLLGVVNAFDNPTRQAFVVELVGREHLQNAIALNSSLFNSARVIGPAVGGIVITAVGIGQAFLFNGLSFIPLIVGLLFLRPGQFYAVPQPQRGNIFRQLAAGVRYAAGTPEVLLILMTMAVMGTFGYNFSTILPLIAKYVLHAGALGLGILTSALGVGSLIAALGVASARRTSHAVLLGAAALFSVVLLLVGLSPWLPLTLALLVLLGAASIVFSASANTRLQLTAPAELRGRVMSLYFLLFAGTTPIGGFLVGVLATRMGVGPTTVLFGAICLLGVAGASLFARRIHTQEAIADTARTRGGVAPVGGPSADLGRRTAPVRTR
jgi:MFS family permease